MLGAGQIGSLGPPSTRSSPPPMASKTTSPQSTAPTTAATQILKLSLAQTPAGGRAALTDTAFCHDSACTTCATCGCCGTAAGLSPN